MAHDTVWTCACIPTEDWLLDSQKAGKPYHNEPLLGLAALSRVEQITSNNSYFSFKLALTILNLADLDKGLLVELVLYFTQEKMT